MLAMPTLRVCAALAAVLACSAACGGKVSVDDDEASAGSGGAGAFASVSSSGPGGPGGPGGPVGVTSGPDATSVGAGASGGAATVGAGGGTTSHLCYRLVDNAYVESVVLETGAMAPGPQVPPGFPSADELTTPPAVRADEIFHCANGWLGRTDLLAGTVETSDVPCLTVGLLNDDLAVANDPSPEAMDVYDNWDDVMAGKVTVTVPLPGYSFSRIGAEGDLVFFAWHSAHELNRFSTSVLRDLGPLSLEGFDDWIQGLDITGELWLVINGGIAGDTLYVFDAQSGTALFDVFAPSGSTRGLTCDTLIPL